MKKMFALLLTSMMIISMAACGSTGEGKGSADGDGSSNEPMVIRMNCSMSRDHLIGKGYQLIADKIEELSNGSMKVDLYYDNGYCSDTENLTEMAKGNLEISGSGAAYVIEYVPQYGFLNMAYVYDSSEHALKVLNGDIGAQIFETVGETTGMLPLSAYYFGTRNILLTKDIEVKSPEDLANVKMRTNGTETMMQMMEAMGANPVGVSLSETYSALQTGVVDGQENPISACIQYNFPEISKSWTYTEHYVDCSWIAVSYEWFKNLSSEQQQIVRDAVTEGCDYISEAVLEEEANTDAILEEAGVKVYRIDKTPFEEAAYEYYQQFADEWDQDVLDAILACK